MIEIISATRLPEDEFWKKSALGVSLRRLASDARLRGQVAFSNQYGLPGIFNARILAADSPELLVFVHDDVWIDDYFLADRVIEGLETYDVIGVAGNRRRLPHQPAWGWVAADSRFTWDDKAKLSGCIAHGSGPFGTVSFFGAAPADCELLDGVFLAARKSALKAGGVLFDPAFEFHFYDLDFCRSARQRGLRLGTWPICLTHQSAGAFRTEKWLEKYEDYIDKWGS
jgi:GT2 family glycosyltransferase